MQRHSLPMFYVNCVLFLYFITSSSSSIEKRIVGTLGNSFYTSFYARQIQTKKSKATQQIINKSEWCVDGDVSEILDFCWQNLDDRYKEIDSLKNVIQYLKEKDPRKFSVDPSTTIKL